MRWDVLESMGVPSKVARSVVLVLGHGVEGFVYELRAPYAGSVLKVNFRAARSALAALKRKAKGKSWAARILESGTLHTPAGHAAPGFWYRMPRLWPIPLHLVHLVDDVGVMRIRLLRKSITSREYETYFEHRTRAMPEALRKVVRAAYKAGYHDLHGTNVMMTRDGKFKVVDLESMIARRFQ